MDWLVVNFGAEAAFLLVEKLGKLNMSAAQEDEPLVWLLARLSQFTVVNDAATGRAVTFGLPPTLTSLELQKIVHLSTDVFSHNTTSLTFASHRLLPMWCLREIFSTPWHQLHTLELNLDMRHLTGDDDLEGWGQAFGDLLDRCTTLRSLRLDFTASVDWARPFHGVGWFSMTLTDLILTGTHTTGGAKWFFDGEQLGNMFPRLVNLEISGDCQFVHDGDADTEPAHNFLEQLVAIKGLEKIKFDIRELVADEDRQRDFLRHFLEFLGTAHNPTARSMTEIIIIVSPNLEADEDIENWVDEFWIGRREQEEYGSAAGQQGWKAMERFALEMVEPGQTIPVTNFVSNGVAV